MGEDADRTKQDTRPYWKVTASLFFSLLGTALFLVIGIRALGFFMPFVIGWFIAYLAHPLVGWLENRVKIKIRISLDHYTRNRHCSRTWLSGNCETHS